MDPDTGRDPALARRLAEAVGDMTGYIRVSYPLIEEPAPPPWDPESFSLIPDFVVPALMDVLSRDAPSVCSDCGRQVGWRHTPAEWLWVPLSLCPREDDTVGIVCNDCDVQRLLAHLAAWRHPGQPRPGKAPRWLGWALGWRRRRTAGG